MGPAGSGKSTLTAALADWLEDHDMDVTRVNFDPAAEVLPYTPDVDVREHVRATDLMHKYGLGPNGALVLSVDLLINHVVDIKREIEETKSNYVLVDLPGQLEVVAFRRIGPQLLKELVKGSKSASVFVIDARLASSPPSAMSALLLSLSAFYRIGLPQVLLVNKVDLLAESKGVEIDLDKLSESIFLLKLFSEEGSCEVVSYSSPFLSSDVSLSICESLKEIYGEVLAVSAKLGMGMDSLYASLQRILAGGEDFLTEEPSGW